jgi:hypothetical protein
MILRLFSTLGLAAGILMRIARPPLQSGRPILVAGGAARPALRAVIAFRATTVRATAVWPSAVRASAARVSRVWASGV